MKFKILNQNETDIEVEFNLDEKEWEEACENAYQKEKGKYSLQGFRKGKVPKKMLEKSYGDDVFYEPAINLGFSKMYDEFLSKNKQFKPFTYPELSISKVGPDGLVLNVKVALAPTVKLGEYKGQNIDYKVEKIKQEQIDHELSHYQEKLARIEEVDSVSKIGSVVDINFEGFVNNEPFEGGKAENYDLELGSNTFIPGFEDQLIGLKKGDEKDIVVTFPKDYQAADLASKEATFKIKVNAVKEKNLPELNDDLAKDVSSFNTLDELKADIKNKLEEAAVKKADAEWQQAIISAIIKNSSFTISQKAIDEETEYIISDLEQNLSYQGLSLGLYCQYLNKDMKQLREETKLQAENLIKTRLVLSEIVKLEKIDATKQEMLELIKKQNKNSNFDDAAAEKYYDKISSDKKEVIKNDTIIDKLINFLKQNNLK